jgi:hypothetical protein
MRAARRANHAAASERGAGAHGAPLPPEPHPPLAELTGLRSVTLPANPPEHVRELMRTLGVTIREDKTLPRPVAWRIDEGDLAAARDLDALTAEPWRPWQDRGRTGSPGTSRRR